MAITVGILLFPDVEVLDFAGPYEVFSVAARVATKAFGSDGPPFRVVTVAEGQKTLVARHGLRIAPDYGFEDAPAIDVLIVPGGIVTEPMNNLLTLAWLKRESARVALTASVCTGGLCQIKCTGW